MNQYQWLSVHLFHQPPSTLRLLMEGVLPFVQKLQNNQQLPSFFFIRYAEKGYHIRLRLYGDVEKLQPLVRFHFNSYFQKHPKHQLPNFENKSIQFIPYQPEIERFGGIKNLAIAEKHFYHSSAIVLQLMAQKGGLTYDNAMGHALQLHLAFCYANKFSKNKTILFFKNYFKNWSNTIYQKPTEELIETHFEPAFQAVKASLQPPILKLWDNLVSREEFETSWINQWITDCYFLTTAYQDLSEVKKIGIYHSFVHLTNNRLGIHNEDEVYLSYLLYRLLE